MHGDYSRWTFEPDQNLAAVIVQQGQPLTDSEWNDQAMIAHESVRTVVKDVYGELAAFEAGKLAVPKVTDTKVTFAHRNIYIQGVRTQLPDTHGLEWDRTIVKRPDREPDKPYLAYLEATPLILDMHAIQSLAESTYPLSSPLRLQYQATLGFIRDDDPNANDSNWNKFNARTGKLAKLEWVLPNTASQRLLYRIEIISTDGEVSPTLTLAWSRTNGELQIPFQFDASKTLLKFAASAKPMLQRIRVGQYASNESSRSFVLSERLQRATAKIKKVDPHNLTIELEKELPLGATSTHIRIWDGIKELSSASPADANGAITVLLDAGLRLALKSKDEFVKLGIVQPGDYWLLTTRPNEKQPPQFWPRSPYVAKLAKITGTVADPKFEVANVERTPLGDSMIARNEVVDRRLPVNTPASLVKVPWTARGPRVAVAFDITLRHLAASIKTPQLKQWLHSATLPEVWGLELNKLRDKLLSCFPKPPADNVQFEADLRRVIQDSAVIAQRLDYRGTENDSQFA